MSTSYLNDRPKLGLVEIINNLDSDQKATQNDVRELTHAFRWIGMEVKRPNFDLNADDMNKRMEQILCPDRNLKEYNMLILVIICHGEEGDKLISADGKVCTSVSQIVKKFDEIKDMMERPKILILDCCRGSVDNKGIDVTFTSTKAGPVTSQRSRKYIPYGADIFIAFATIPECVSNTQFQGSPFILILTKKLKDFADSHDLADILVMVADELASKEIGRTKQMCSTETRLRKKVMLKIGEKTYFYEFNNPNGDKCRMFGDENGQGQICYSNQDFCSCILQDGNISWSGRYIFEWAFGDVVEADIHPGVEWGIWTGEGVMYNIRKKWRYEGQLKNCKIPGSDEFTLFYHGSGILRDEDGSHYVGGFELKKKCGAGTHFSKDGKVIDFGFWKDDKLIKKFLT